MSSDSEHISKPSKRVRCRISDSSDSSDDSVIVRIHRRRRVNNVFSDESSGDDSDVQKPGLARRRRKNIIKSEVLNDSNNESGCSSQFRESNTSTEWESDWTSDSVDSEDEKIPVKTSENIRKRIIKKKVVKSPRNSDSEESDGQTEKCPICLLSFRNQEIGTPSSCEHSFCLMCINEWSKNVNTCPVDRQEFTFIYVRSQLGGQVINQIPVEPRNNNDEQIQEDPTYCEICQQCDREDRMLLCDGCDLGYHLECLTPPMHQVPMEEWFCSECSPFNQHELAEVVEIDLDELPDLMAEARCLGVTYGRTRTGLSNAVDLMGRYQPIFRHRLIPRTRQSERVRANIRADRNRAREEFTTTVTTRTIPNFDPEQPSTSSGIDSISENSRGRSPNSTQSRSKRTANNKTKRSKATSRGKKSRKTSKKSDTVLREVRIREYNTDGEQEEIVTYVKFTPQTSRRKHKKRAVKRRKKRKGSTRRRRYCQVGSVGRLTNTKTVRSRLALALGLSRRPRGATASINLAPPSLKSSTLISNSSNLNSAKFRAGIPQVNLFDSNLMLDYTPLGSDDDTNEDTSINGSSLVAIQQRHNSSVSTMRRRIALKGISNSIHHDETRSVDNLLDNIISNQQLWHSNKKNITLKADGTLLLPTNNPESDKKSKIDRNIIDENPNQVLDNDNNIAINPVNENNLDTSVNSAHIIQAPMYSHSRAGGVGNHNADGGGSFRGNYHDRNGRGHGGQDYGMRDTYSGGNGRPNYGGAGPRDSFGHGDIRPPPAALDFSSNFDNRRRPPVPLIPHFRNRLHQNYRNDNNRQRRFNNMDRGGPFRPVNLSQTPPFPHANNFQGPSSVNNISQPILSPAVPLSVPQSEMNLSTNASEVDVRNSSVSNEPNRDESTTVSQSERLEGEECDIYSDIETPTDKSTEDTPKGDDENENKLEDGVMALLPPPVPPSDLLEYDDNSKSDKNNESDNEDLVIDDTPKDTANVEMNENQTEDKYDPFAVASSDSNDSDDDRKMKSCTKKNKSNQDQIAESMPTDNPTMPPLAPPPTPPDFLSMVDKIHSDIDHDDEDEEEKRDDCPNFSIYSSETMDVARHTEQELSQQIGPLEPPPLPPDIPDDDDTIVADVQNCDLSEIPEPSDPYVESLRKERQTLSKIPSKKISSDSRGKITFKIGNKFKFNNRLSSLYDELDDAVEISIAQEKEEEKAKQNSSMLLSAELELKTDKINEKSDENLDSDLSVDNVTAKTNKKSNETTGQGDDGGSLEIPEVSAIGSIVDHSSADSNDSNVPEGSREDLATVLPFKSNIKLVTSVAGTSRGDLSVINSDVEKHDDDSNPQKSPEFTVEPDFQLQKDTVHYNISSNMGEKNEDIDHWESDGAYTPCRDEMPVKETTEKLDKNAGVSTLESGLEPITPPAKDKITDDLDDRCKTPIEYAGLGTEAISETDEAINFEEEITSLPSHKEKDVEDGEIMDESKLSGKKQSDKLSDSEDASNRKKKKEKREKCRQAGEKNKENISSDNQVAWKKISKSTKERQYREKGKHFESRDKEKESFDKSRDKNKYREKSKEVRKKIKDINDRKKEKRKEMPRYDVRKIVAEKPARPRKDEYGRDIRDISRSLSRSRSPARANKRSHSRELRVSRSFSPRMRSRSRSWSRRLARSWSRNRLSPAHKRSVSRSRRKSPPRDRRSISRRRSRSILNRRCRRSVSNQRQRRKRSLSKKRRSRSRSYSRSRSRSKMRSRSRSRSRSRDIRMKDKSKKHKSRSRSKRRRRSRTKSPSPRKATSKSRSKKRVKRKAIPTTTNIHPITMRSRSRSRSRDRSYSRDRNRSRNWSKPNEKSGDRGTFSIRENDRDQQPISGQATSWSAQWTPSWSRSRSHTPTGVNRQHDDRLLEARGWSPNSLIGIPSASISALPPSSPPSQSPGTLQSANISGMISNNEPLDDVASPKNLTVILRNKDAIKNRKRKEKRAKERKKSRESERRKISNKRNRTPPPSKEVFASGDNILVSVCFNNENATGQLNNTAMHLSENIPLSTTAKRRHREPTQAESSKKPKKDKSKDKRSKSPKINKRDKKRKSKAAEIAASKKPVAVIDLDQSPFREQTPSPRDIIVLSDDEQDDDHNNNHHNINISNNVNNNNNACSTGNSNNANTNSNTDGNSINKITNINDDDDEDDDDDDDEGGGSNDIRILGISTLSEQQKRMASSAVQQHLQLLHQQQAEQQQQSTKSQNQDDEKELQQQDQQQLQHKLHLQQRCLLSSDIEQFIPQGPKTPPEPQVKFSINKQPSNLRPASMMHPLFDGDEDDEEIEGDDDEDDDDDRGNVENDVDDEGDKSLEGQAGENARESSNKLTTKDKSEREENDMENDESTRCRRGEEGDDNEDIDEAEEEEDKVQRAGGQKTTLENDGISKEDLKKLRSNEDGDGGVKIGPNTPPEPPMSPFTSPDAYDPFDPTKSRSPSPSAMDSTTSNDQKHCESTGTSVTSIKDVTSISGNEKSDSDKPKIISMTTIKHAMSPDKDGVGDSTKIIDNSTSKDQLNQSVVPSSSANSFATINLVLATVAAAVQRSGILSTNNPSASNVQRTLGQTNHLATGTQVNKRTNERAPQLTNLFMNSVKSLPMNIRSGKPASNRNIALPPQNGSDLPLEPINDTTTIDTSSPYSPGSSLSDGIFDPPSPARNHHSPSRPPGPSGSNIMKNSNNGSKNLRADKKDAFDALFGSPPLARTSSASKLRMKNPIAKSKKISNSKVGVRIDKNELQILDDLPSSAAEMQVKDKFLKKLTRQLCVVEEVKLALKPHYTKKHVTKEEYKDIMRKAVPKICHNRTGEINSQKIIQLIEAYVKRCRSNKKKAASGSTTNNSAKPLRPSKNPWS